MTSTVNARAVLDRKLAESFAEQWDPARPTRVETVEQDGAVGLRFLVRKSDGNWVKVHDEPPVRLTTEADVDDLLANGLSTFLMKHPAWPR
jgi:hypothetical protein